MRLIDWIWTIRGTIALPPGATVDQAFAGLEPLWRQPGTQAVRDGAVLHIAKVAQASLDPLAMVDRARIELRHGETGLLLGYTLVSRALGACLLAPVLFVVLMLPLWGDHGQSYRFPLLFLALYAWGRVVEPRRLRRVLADHAAARC